MSQKDMVVEFLKNHKSELKSLFGVQKIGLFGSVARGEETPKSDIDIAVEIESDNRFRSFFELKYYLESAFDKKVDLGIESTLKPAVRKYIQNEIIYV